GKQASSGERCQPRRDCHGDSEARWHVGGGLCSVPGALQVYAPAGQARRSRRSGQGRRVPGVGRRLFRDGHHAARGRRAPSHLREMTGAKSGRIPSLKHGGRSHILPMLQEQVGVDLGTIKV
ncbi:unnamed protein product, partial [Ixodes pacificus]